MCSLIICHSCKKYSFSGCGQHLSILFANKKPEELCLCNKKIREYLEKIKSK